MLWRKLIFEVSDSHLFQRAQGGGEWITFKKPEMDKTPRMVAFCNLVGTDIAPVSKKLLGEDCDW